MAREYVYVAELSPIKNYIDAWAKEKTGVFIQNGQRRVDTVDVIKKAIVSHDNEIVELIERLEELEDVVEKMQKRLANFGEMAD